MPVWKLQVQFGGDTALARDKAVITPHFNDQGVGTDPDGLCEDLATALSTWLQPANSREVTVTAYDAQGTPPVFPQGTAQRNPLLNPPSMSPRDVAIVLSFFSERNLPRRRGRLYIPYYVARGASSVSARPGVDDLGRIAALPPILGALGGPDVDWCVYSRMDNVARPVTNWWIDNEFDTQRRRGLLATSRTTGTTAED